MTVNFSLSESYGGSAGLRSEGLKSGAKIRDTSANVGRREWRPRKRANDRSMSRG